MALFINTVTIKTDTQFRLGTVNCARYKCFPAQSILSINLEVIST